MTDCSHAESSNRARACTLSVVTSVYRSLPFLADFLAQMREAIRQAGVHDYEIVFVNDGSPDESLSYLMSARETDPRIRIVDLSRNFGHHKAALAGLSYARGELVFIIDCDLEVSPGVLPRFIETMMSTSADVVYGVQPTRKGGPLERLGGDLFWKIFNRLSDTHVPANVLTERLMTRDYVRSLLRLGDRNIFLAGMMYWTGFHQVGISVEKTRRNGASTYSLRRRISLLVEAITSFSTVPLKLVLGIGLTLTFCTMAFALTILVRKILFPSSVLAGFTTLSLLVIGTSGVIITLMGILGLYISRIFVQTQGRPAFIVRNFHGEECQNEREP
ncbi:glycosyltransferase family 2 protein [Luteimonas saliphila]|uniref:glycosyltransferase family 2 protein n=1 Tax=Luteimonas saliphila TaxID=2804919 RepID=UPI00235275F6|nr:glycosyltransferase family 2 protein [Luteimonas saliphila]